MIRKPGGRSTGTLDVVPAEQPTRVRMSGEDRDIFLDWDQAIDDDGKLRRCLICGGPLYRKKALPQVTGFVVVLAFGLALVGLLGFADNIPLLIGMTIVLLIDIGILLFAGIHLECYQCSSSHRNLPIADYHRPWDRSIASRHKSVDQNSTMSARSPAGS